MTTLAEIEQEIGNVLAVADELDEEQEQPALAYLEELGVQETEKADGVIYALRKRQSEIQFLKDEEDRIRSRRKSAEKRLQEFKDYLASIFQREGITRIRALKGTLYLRQSSSVEVTDTESLPADLVHTKVSFEPKKKDIRERLNSGEEVPGARLNTAQQLCVR
ncbi:MAG: siphovirus Gp157 family protein [Desulfohalobiaceae bacterium]|nr:siphovirus Gp157 family protein [Desulfohalobiaceae bacterium]